MPIYEYQCDSCGAQREVIVKPGEAVLPSCPRCRKKMRRVISPTAFILKGSGWYVTDYPSQDRRKGLDGEKVPPAEKKESADGKKKESTDTAPPKKDAEPKATAEKKSKRRKE